MMTTMPNIGARRLTLRRAIVAALLVPVALTFAACGPASPTATPTPVISLAPTAPVGTPGLAGSPEPVLAIPSPDAP